MIMLCIRGALIFVLSGASLGFWIWALVPFPRGKYGSAEYLQSQGDSFTAVVGGLGLLACLGFIAALAYNYWPR